MAPTRIGDAPDGDHNLDEFSSEEGQPGTVPAMAGSRIRSATTDAVGHLLALCTFAALRCDSFTWRARRMANHASRRGREQATRLQRRLAAAVQSTSTEGTLELEGTLVATALAVVALGYGGLLLTSWSDPTNTSSPAVSPLSAGLPVSGGTTYVEAAPVTPLVTATRLAPPTEVRFPSRVVTASSLNRIMRRNDKRSLQHAFDNLRRETLAFHRCGMQMTAADRAVANCDGTGGGRRVRWTIDFQRIGNRWSIQRVAAR